MTEIAEELATVEWETLAGWLDVEQGKIDGIESNCRGGGSDPAQCFRNKLVRTFCESKSGSIQDVIEEIAKALERMNKNLQASKIRKLDVGKSS